jgi:GntR family transcriptional repressor for pyruvate dehydrogenase complex
MDHSSLPQSTNGDFAVTSGLEPVRKTRVYEEVVAQIQRLMTDGRLKPGDKLPPERELAEAFSVSRTSVRDAIRVLELMGLLEPRQGEGTVVRDLSPDSLVNPLASLLVRNRMRMAELFDVRKMLEPPLAGRAAVNATDAELANLQEILRRQEQKVRRGELAIDEDSEFHYAIATAARNGVVLRVLDVLMDLLRESRERSLQVAGRLERSFEAHRRIMSALTSRNAAASEAAMRQHIEEIEEVLLTKGHGP